MAQEPEQTPGTPRGQRLMARVNHHRKTLRRSIMDSLSDARSAEDELAEGEEGQGARVTAQDLPEDDDPILGPRAVQAFLLILGLGMIAIGVAIVIGMFTREAVTTAPPRFGVTTANLIAPTCKDAPIMLSNPPADVLTDEPTEQMVARDRAEQIADETLANYLGYGPDDKPALAGGPEMLSVTLPDGTRAPVWYRIWLPDVPDIGSPAAGVVLFIEPITGEPLVLYDGVTVTDPVAGGCDDTSISEAVEDVARSVLPTRRTIALVLSLIAGVTSLAFWQRRARRDAEAHRRANGG